MDDDDGDKAADRIKGFINGDEEDLLPSRSRVKKVISIAKGIKGISKRLDEDILDEDEIKESLRKIKKTRYMLKYGEDSKYRAVYFKAVYYDGTRLKRGDSKCTNTNAYSNASLVTQ